MFASHHWPRFGADDVSAFLAMQRDVYRWMHDQTMRLANQGYGPDEIAAEIHLPEEFDQSHVRGYYGAVPHNCRAVYNRYLGWYDGNPANLDPLPPVLASTNYVDFMGGADAVLEKARSSFERGEYRWVVQVVNHVVYADPANQSARDLQADALEQLGLPVRVGHLAQRIPDGGDGAPSRPVWTGRVARSTRWRRRWRSSTSSTSSGCGSIRRGSRGARWCSTSISPTSTRIICLGVGRSVIHHRADAVDDEAIASIRIDRATFAAALSDAAALQSVEISGDRDTVMDFFAGLTVFGRAALIEPRQSGQSRHQT